MITPEDDRRRPLELSERQSQVWWALRAKAQPKYPLHDWYLGALVALTSTEDSNPDRLAQAGNSLRELLEKLPRALGTEVIGPDTNVLKQKREAVGAALIRVKAQQFANGWIGQTITIELSSTLEKFDEYVELSNRPSRRERTFAGLKKLDPMMPALPQQLQQEKWQRYNSVSKQLEDFTHHRGSGTDDDFRNCLQMEDLVLDFMAPVTADDQNDLLQIISKGASVSDEEIKAALRLVERRGANYAFFFENVHDPAWIKPLEVAGHFKTPSLVETAGEGLVAFPVWWPMVFLRRIAADAPEEVLRILLAMDPTNNPQVLNGVVEIASQLPIELAVRLEPMITDYINKPFHV